MGLEENIPGQTIQVTATTALAASEALKLLLPLTKRDHEIIEHIKNGGGIKDIEVKTWNKNAFEIHCAEAGVPVIMHEAFNGLHKENTLFYSFRDTDVPQMREIEQMIIRESKEQNLVLSDTKADRIFGEHYVAKLDNLNDFERTMLQRELRNLGVQSHSTLNPLTDTYSMEILQSDINAMSGDVRNKQMDKLDIAMRNMLIKELSPVGELYKRHYEHDNKMKNTISMAAKGKLHNEILYDSSNPSHYLLIKKDGAIEYDMRFNPETGKNEQVIKGDISARSEKFVQKMQDVVTTFGSIDQMKYEEFQKADRKDLNMYHQERKIYNDLEADLSKHLRELHMQEEQMIEVKLSFDTNDHVVHLYDSNQTIGDFISKEVREDIKDVSFDMKISELKDLISDKMSQYGCDIEIYVPQERDQDIEITNEDIIQSELEVVESEEIAETVQENDDLEELTLEDSLHNPKARSISGLLYCKFLNSY